LIQFSLNQGWIAPPSQEKLEAFSSVDTARVEAEIQYVKKLTTLYLSLSRKNPPEILSHHIRDLLASQDLIIFQRKKV
jgi:hypothetical protein